MNEEHEFTLHRIKRATFPTYSYKKAAIEEVQALIVKVERLEEDNVRLLDELEILREDRA